jgi:hypothetical protein
VSISRPFDRTESTLLSLPTHKGIGFLGEFDESAGKLISYKYAMWREGSSPLRENLVARRWVIATEGTVKWRDTWVCGRES